MPARRSRMLRRLVLLLVIVPAAVEGARAASEASWVGHTTPAEGTSLQVLAVAPSAPEVIYAARDARFGGVVKSVDGGRSWAAADLGLSRADLGFAGSGLVSISSLAIRANDPDVVYAGANLDGGSVLWRSTTGGASWRRFGGPTASDGTALYILSLAIDPRRPRLMYLGTQVGLFRSQDEGRTWGQTSAGLVDDEGHPVVVRFIAIEPAAPDVVWAASPTHLYRSRNRGASWTRRDRGLPEGAIQGIGFSPTSGNGYLSFDSTGVLPFWRTTNHGLSWQQASAGLTAGGRIAVMPGAPDSLLSVSSAGVFHSVDAGDSWSAGALPFGSVATEGVASGRTWVVAGVGAFRSEDLGLTFEPANQGLDATTFSVTIEPAEGNVYVGFGTGSYRSTDGGASFSALTDGEAPLATSAQAIAFGAGSPPTVDVIARHVGDSFHVGFYRSTDGGATFEPRGGDATAFGTDFSPASLTTLGGDADHLLCGELGVGETRSHEAGLYRSLDGGLTWARTYTPPPGTVVFQPLNMAADPTGGRPVFVATLSFAGSTYTGNVLRSRAGGAGWDAVFDGLGFPLVAVGAGGRGHRRGVAYVADLQPGSRQGLWRSLDQGTTWERLAGGLPNGPADSVFGVVADPRVRGRVWAAVGGTVWVSTNDGDTWAPESATGLPYGAQFIFSPALALDPGIAGVRPARLWAMTNLGLFSLEVERAP